MYKKLYAALLLLFSAGISATSSEDTFYSHEYKVEAPWIRKLLLQNSPFSKAISDLDKPLQQKYSQQVNRVMPLIYSRIYNKKIDTRNNLLFFIMHNTKNILNVLEFLHNKH